MVESTKTQEIKDQVASNQKLGDDSQAELKTGTLKAEQPIKEEIPSTAEVVRGYAKWTDNDGNFRKVPLDGTNAIREPAHEQHELTVEERDNLDQALALKTPRRKDGEKSEADVRAQLQNEEIRNDEVYQELKDGNAIDSVAPAGEPTGPDDADQGKNDGSKPTG